MNNCTTAYCRNRAAYGKGGLCHKCYQRRWKKNNPFKYYFNIARQNAKRRCIPFNLTFEQWKAIWLESGHWEDKMEAESINENTWTMDRVDPNKGYEPGNVEIIELWRNVYKWMEHGKFHLTVIWRKRWAERNNKPIEECPF